MWRIDRFVLKYIFDVTVWFFAAPLALWLRLEGGSQWQEYFPHIITYTLAIGCLKAGVAYYLGFYRQSWRKVSVPDLAQLIKGVASVTVVALTAVLVSHGTALGLPRSMPIIEGLLALVMLSSTRLVNRLWHERRRSTVSNGRGKHVLIVGAGEAGTLLAREMLRHPESGLLPVGFLDDNPVKHRERFLGLPVLGMIDDLPSVVKQHDINEVLVSMPSAPGPAIRHVVELARLARVRCRTIPGVYEIISGQVSISQIREVALDDLLRREPVHLDLDRICDYLEDRVVLVSGAGGSIGAEIVRQIIRFNPQKILLMGRGENSLYSIERELDSHWPNLPYETVVANIQMLPKLEYVFQKHRPQVIFHAAAHKHVPMMEHNPDEAVFNNAMGTQNLVECALKYGVERFVNISTDKAVNPTSIMGATKRVAEYIVLQGVARAHPSQVFISVRFGNVLGSRGSVVPLFKEQVRLGGPVTVTHPDMTRFFMTIPEAAQLVIEAGGIGENGRIYVLDMGDPVKIVDLAQDLIRLSGLQPGIDVEITFTGIRPGEKLYEEIIAAEEETLPSSHDKIFVACHTEPPPELDSLLERLFAAAASRDKEHIRDVLGEIVPTYNPTPQPPRNGRHSQAV
jgi:FlaA1/EpsC-like NDP-sugar epimerase